jgi:transcription antitermination protein NusB
MTENLAQELSNKPLEDNRNPPNTSLPKSFSRLVAIQMLYAYSLDDFFFFDYKYQNIDEERIQNHLSFYRANALGEDVKVRKTDNKFLKAAILYIAENYDKIDMVIKEFLKRESSYKVLDKLMKAILRVAVYELAHNLEADKKIIISQYVMIAESFYDHEEVAFLNAVIDKIAAKIRND